MNSPSTRILIASDSFKDALSATAVCAAIAKGLRQRLLPADIIEFPLADGGEGMLEVLTQHLSLRTIQVATVDPLFRVTNAPIGLSADGKLAVIEMAKASGLQLLDADERHAPLTTTLGTGKLIAYAIEQGVERIILGIGGSASHDVGLGVATALGWKFLDQSEKEIRPIGRDLNNVARIVPPANELKVKIDVLCDVTNPLLGKNGAAYVYAKQKGATTIEIEMLEQGTRRFADRASQQMTKAISIETPGAGAAGGLGFAAVAFLNATLHRGVEIMLDLVGFEQALENVDLIVTGEGRLDSQTMQGKLIYGVCQRAQRRHIPVIALTGDLKANEQQLKKMGLTATYCINTVDASLAEMLKQTANNLTATAAHMPLQQDILNR